jgi:hypothetical protein
MLDGFASAYNDALHYSLIVSLLVASLPLARTARTVLANVVKQSSKQRHSAFRDAK